MVSHSGKSPQMGKKIPAITGGESQGFSMINIATLLSYEKNL
jgi:hypothetical protein